MFIKSGTNHTAMQKVGRIKKWQYHILIKCQIDLNIVIDNA